MKLCSDLLRSKKNSYHICKKCKERPSRQDKDKKKNKINATQKNKLT